MAWTASPDGTIDYFTQTWYEYTGQTITEAMNMGCRSALHPHDDERAFPIYTNAIASKQPYDVEKRIRRAIDGQYRWHLVRAMPLFDIYGNITLWAGTCTDIHDQKMVAEELEEKVKQRTIELQQANADLERSNNELEQFAYIASHDLQEPLRKIQILSDRLLLDLAEYYYENAENLTKKIQLAANRMSSLLKELLNYSRLSYKESNPFKKVKLSNALENVFNDLETVITQKKASIRFEALPEIEATELLIIQLFHNLLSNSLKFTAPSRSPLITIFSEELTETEKYAFQLEPSRQYCKIVFQDNGIGFDNQFAGRIFTIFQRLNNVDKFPGTGIGLALCKKIVTNHQGLIFAEAVEGDGATFTIILPYTQVR
jgi:PAS domain S-box-containing protein